MIRRPFQENAIKIHAYRRWLRTALCTALTISLATTLATPLPAAALNAIKVDQTYLDQQHLAFNGKLAGVWHIGDDSGLHVLLLTTLAGPSHEKKNGRSERKERIELHAVYYKRVNEQWVQDWTINDAVDCPELDSSASFFTNAVTFTDLDHDGRAEVSVPYKMFCGGGVESDTVKVIMRQGQDKFALRGESLVTIKGQGSFGGSKTADKSLDLPANAAFRRHLLAVWKTVYIKSY